MRGYSTESKMKNEDLKNGTNMGPLMKKTKKKQWFTGSLLASSRAELKNKKKKKNLGKAR